jgi:hypothetical protein
LATNLSNEKEFLPLQAADMYAWSYRHNWILNKVIYMPPPRVLKKLASISAVERNYWQPLGMCGILCPVLLSLSLKELAYPPNFREHISENSRERKKARKRNSLALKQTAPDGIRVDGCMYLESSRCCLSIRPSTRPSEAL